MSLRRKIVETGFRQGENRYIPKNTANRMMGIPGSIRDIIDAIGYFKLYLILFSRPYKFRHIRLPTGKTAMMFTHLFSVHRKDRMAIYPVETKNDPFPFIIGRKGK